METVIEERRPAIEAAIKEAERDTIDAMAQHVQRLNEAYRRAGTRVLRETPDPAVLNRCPRCERIVRTPRARQCMWCFDDWHEAATSWTGL